MTEQGNPGIYIQIDEWLPLYKGNIYVVDEVTVKGLFRCVCV